MTAVPLVCQTEETDSGGGTGTQSGNILSARMPESRGLHVSFIQKPLSWRFSLSRHNAARCTALGNLSTINAGVGVVGGGGGIGTNDSRFLKLIKDLWQVINTANSFYLIISPANPPELNATPLSSPKLKHMSYHRVLPFLQLFIKILLDLLTDCKSIRS